MTNDNTSVDDSSSVRIFERHHVPTGKAALVKLQLSKQSGRRGSDVWLSRPCRCSFAGSFFFVHSLNHLVMVHSECDCLHKRVSGHTHAEWLDFDNTPLCMTLEDQDLEIFLWTANNDRAHYFTSCICMLGRYMYALLSAILICTFCFV